MQNTAPKTTPPLLRVMPLCLLCFSLAYFLAATLPGLNSYGISQDEVEWFAICREYLAEGLFGPYLLRLEGYCGTLPAMSGALFMLVFGNTLFAAKLALVAFGAGAVLFTYLFAATLFTPLTGALATMLMVANPNFIACTRTSFFGEAVFQIMFTALWGWLFCKAMQKDKAVWFFAGAATVGLAVWAKIMALGPAGGCVLAFGLACAVSKKWRQAYTKPLIKHKLWLAAGFLCGLCPMIYSNLFEMPFQTIKCFAGAMQHTPQRTWNNANIWHNLKFRLEQLTQFWDNNTVMPCDGFSAHFAALFAASLAGILIYILALQQKQSFSKTKLLFLTTWTVLVFCSTCFVPNAAHFIHLNILFPLPEMVVAAFVGLSVEFAVKNRFFPSATLLCTAAYIILSVFITHLHNHLLARNISPLPMQEYSTTMSRDIANFLAQNGFTQNIELPAPFSCSIIPSADKTHYMSVRSYPDKYTYYTRDSACYLPNKWPYSISVCLKDHKPGFINNPERHTTKIALFADRFTTYEIFFSWKPDCGIPETLVLFQPEQTTNLNVIKKIHQAILKRQLHEK